jgi:hypothetical protein
MPRLGEQEALCPSIADPASASNSRDYVDWTLLALMFGAHGTNLRQRIVTMPEVRACRARTRANTRRSDPPSTGRKRDARRRALRARIPSNVIPAKAGIHPSR